MNDESAGYGRALVRPISDLTARQVDRAVARLVDQCYAEATAIVVRERSRLDALAVTLLERESLNESEIMETVATAL